MRWLDSFSRQGEQAKRDGRKNIGESIFPHLTRNDSPMAMPLFGTPQG
jgi:hypothetical protein